MFAKLIFYIFGFMLIGGAVTVVLSKSPIRSVLALIFCFVNAAGMLLFAGAEYLAATLIIVYVGAVVVLFLFIIMMLSSEIQHYPKILSKVTVPIFVLFSIVLIVGCWWGNRNFVNSLSALNILGVSEVTNTKQIGHTLYTKHFLHFQLAGMILLTAMIGVIILAHRKLRDGIKKQNLWKQLFANPSDRIKLVQPKSGSGVEI